MIFALVLLPPPLAVMRMVVGEMIIDRVFVVKSKLTERDPRGMVTELGTPTTFRFDELRLITKSVVRVAEIDTVPRRVVALTDKLTVTGAGAIDIGENWLSTTGAIGRGVAMGARVLVGAGVAVAILITTFCAKFCTAGNGVATPAKIIGVRVGVGVPTAPNGDTTIVKDLRLVWVIPLSVVVAKMVMVTDVGCDTASSRTSMHHAPVVPKNELIGMLFLPDPLTVHPLFSWV